MKIELYVILFILIVEPITVVNGQYWSPIPAADSKRDTFIKQTIVELERADPARDLQAALLRGDKRFVGVMGFALEVPGVEDYYEHYKSYGVRVIEGTSDFIENDDIRRLNELAYKYALRYNRLLLETIRSK